MIDPIFVSLVAIFFAIQLSAAVILCCWIYDRRVAGQPVVPRGTLSLLFGVHQVFWHPYTVWRAWRALYGAPTWRELACIIVHDWGYWGSPDMDGEIGSKHPIRSGLIAIKLGLSCADYEEIANHSRHLAFAMGHTPSRLCWADKLSMVYDPNWFYLIRARLSGEIDEYRENAARAGFINRRESDGAWLVKLKAHLTELSYKAVQDDERFIRCRQIAHLRARAS